MTICHRILLSVLAVSAAASMAAGDEATVEFAKAIQPILERSCVECHGPDKQKGRLRLDSKAEAFKNASIIVRGKAEESEIYKRVILPPGDDDVMPAKGDPLTKAETDLLRDWINQGAIWPDDVVFKSSAPPTEPEDPRTPVEPSVEEKEAVAQLQALGVSVRPVAMNVPWTLASFRGIDSNILDQAFPWLSKVLTLEELNLAGLALKDEQLQHLSGLVNLTRLHLEKTGITDAGLVHLKPLVNLTYLNLYETGVTDGGLEQLEALKGLKKLYLWQTKVTDAGADRLRAALPAVDINRGWEAKVAQAEAEEGTTGPEKKQSEGAEPKSDD